MQLGSRILYATEILIYIGNDTIKLKGEFITSHVTQWDRVNKGDLLIEIDLENIKAAGYDVKTPVVITNTEQYKEVQQIKVGDVIVSENILQLKV
ncbi:PTS glucose transporter subunit IIA [Paraliobacillus sediminis]|uniref:PTS sugar transporter subunit IIA n=1 Tax=Paraliobacillus sediminis TaxID=1885916 RepID=UPI000E3E71A3|nr:PTS glucose transporter subunit IIA [Paraliobacillus sediminis]